MKQVVLPYMGFGVMPGMLYFAKDANGVRAFADDIGIPKDRWEEYVPEGRVLARTTSTNYSPHVLVSINAKQMKEQGLTLNECRSLLAHEAVHVAQAVFIEMGEEKAGEEVMAYLVQACCVFLFDQFDKCKIS